MTGGGWGGDASFSSGLTLVCRVDAGGAALFVDVTLPSLIGDTDLAGARLVVLASARTAAAVRRHPGFSAIEARIPVEFLGGDASSVAALLERMAGSGRLVYLPEGAVCCSGFLAGIAARAAQGVRAVLMAPLLIDGKAGMPPVGMAPRQAAAFGLSHLHPVIRAWEWSSPGPPVDQDGCLWRYADGALLRTLNPEPVFIDMREVSSEAVKEYPRIDTGLVHRMCVLWQDIAFVCDSDEAVLLQVAGPIKVRSWNGGVYANLYVRVTGLEFGPLHRWSFLHPYNIHSGPVSNEYIIVERESQNIVHRLTRRGHTMPKLQHRRPRPTGKTALAGRNVVASELSVKSALNYLLHKLFAW